MKKTWLFMVVFSFILMACGSARLKIPAPTLEMAGPVAARSTPLPSATAVVPVWKAFPLVDSARQVVFANETQEHQRKEIFGSGVTLATDTRWVIHAQVDRLVQDVGTASTGIVLLGYTKSGNVQTFVLVYQMGSWSIGYQPIQADPTFPYWQTLPNLTSPTQSFELSIARDGKNVSIKNDQGFEFQQTMPEKLFDGAQVIRVETQIGPQTKITLAKLGVEQLQKDEIVHAHRLPADFIIPTAIASGEGEPDYVFHVAVNGNDTNPGTPDKPWATIEHARDVIRTISPNMHGPIKVYIHGGTYSVRQPIKFTTSDAGQNGHDIIYQAAAGEAPIFSGGVTVTNWQKVPDSPLWKTILPDIRIFRQLYVNGLRAQRAASNQPVVGKRWLAGDFSKRDGIVISSPQMPDFSRPQDLELHWIYDWKDMRLLVKGVAKNPDGTKTIWMQQPYYAYALWMERDDKSHPWIPKFDVPFYLENAFELLDEPSEWYYNADTHELWYQPRAGEDMRTANAIVPQTQNLLEITGGAVGQEVHNLVFDGLAFEYAGWTQASETGTFGWQAQNLITQTGWGEYAQAMTPAHVQVNSAHDIRFERCRFTHLGAVGLHLNNNVDAVTVQGNLFHDISDGAIVVGHWNHAYITAPAIQAPPQHNLIANNLINDVGVEYWGAPAITAYYVNNVHIVHNEIAQIPYSGISLGWGWSSSLDSTTAHDNLVANNLITDLTQRARDGGGIYTLGQQPGTLIDSNVIRRMKGDYACFYTDDGSALITLQNNVCDTAPGWLDIWMNTIHDNRVLNSYTNVKKIRNEGVNIQIENTVYSNGQAWPPAAQAIIDNAGLESAYAYLHNWLDQQ